MSKVRPLTPKQEDRRRRILSAARAMVADHGYEGMVMSQVAEKAGVSPTTLYNLYNTKDQLVMESLQELIAENQNRVIRESKAAGWELIMALVRNGAWMVSTEPAYAEAITHALLRATPGEALVTTLLEATRDNLVVSVKAMAANGELAEGIDVFELATSITGVYWSSFILWNKGLVNLQDMDRTLQVNSLAFLIGVSRGSARDAMQAELDRISHE